MKETIQLSIEDGQNMWTKSEIDEEVEVETYLGDFSDNDKAWINKRVVQWVEREYNTILND